MEICEKLWMGEKYVLGPMVRANSLPLRLACLEFGANTVYSEEIPCFRAFTAKRYENKLLNTVDFITKSGSRTDVLFRTHAILEKEQQCCVLQLGASESTSALKAAQVFEGDVAAIDINMGCPKHYSISRGMGSELMSKPETAEDIIKTLKRNLSIPVSVKTRIYAVDNIVSSSTGSSEHNIDIVKSVEWVRRLQSCGVDAVAIHARTAKEKNCHATHDHVYNILRDTLNSTNTPMIYNGDIWGREDILRLRKSRHDWVTTGRQSCAVETFNNDYGEHEPSVKTDGCYMLCRAALWDPSVFATLRGDNSSGAAHPSLDTCNNTQSSAVRQPITTSLTALLSKMLTLSADTANCPLNTRFLLQQILAARKMLHCELRSRMLKVFDLSGLSQLINDIECEEYVRNEKMRQLTTIMSVTNDINLMNNNTANDNNVVGNVHIDHSNTTNSSCSTRTSNANDSKTNNKTNKFDTLQNNDLWPGIVSSTTHEYNDSYFDDNYYIAFRKCIPQHKQKSFVYSHLNSNSNVEDGNCVDVKRSSFSLAYSTSTTTVVKKRRKIETSGYYKHMKVMI